ncbi:MAG: hypothetical protein ACE5IA_06935 [Dehalococcoidia bacterium]
METSIGIPTTAKCRIGATWWNTILLEEPVIASSKLPLLSLLVAILAFLVGVGSCGTTWYIYINGVRPQTEFQRVDVELQRLKERIDEERQIIDQLRTSGVDAGFVGLREEKINDAMSLYSEAWNAWLIEHDYPKAERLLKEGASSLPPRMIPFHWIGVIVVSVMLLSLLFYLAMSLYWRQTAKGQAHRPNGRT